MTAKPSAVDGPGPVRTRPPTEATGKMVELRSISKAYGSRDNRVAALTEVTAGFPAGTFTAIMGASGSGKSTLLQCAAGLDRVDSGEVVIGGTVLASLKENALTRMRRQHIGFVFQSFNLVPSLTARQNVELPMRLAGHRPAKSEITSALTELGLAGREGHRPSQLSGGQQQRVAIARALVTRPKVLFADEPTGALDSAASRNVLAILRDLVSSRGQTIIMVTHDPVVAAAAGQVIFLADGRLAGELANPTADTVAGRLASLEDTPC
jgi:putative ABC transport system ATP-binding protein